MAGLLDYLRNQITGDTPDAQNRAAVGSAVNAVGNSVSRVLTDPNALARTDPVLSRAFALPRQGNGATGSFAAPPPAVNSNPLALTANESVVTPTPGPSKLQGYVMGAPGTTATDRAEGIFSPSDIPELKITGGRPANNPVQSAPVQSTAPQYPALTDANASTYRDDNGVIEYIRPGTGANAGGINRSFQFADGQEVAAPNLVSAISRINAAYQQQVDAANALGKPVGAPLTLGEAQTLAPNSANLENTVLKEAGDTERNAATNAATLSHADIVAKAGKNPLYDLAVSTINNAPPEQRPALLNQYLGGKADVKTDPMDKVYSQQLIDPLEQEMYAGLTARGAKPADAFAAVKAKSRELKNK